MNIPLIITNFNQLTYLKNIINWWHWYRPNDPIFIIDNASSYPPLMEYYQSFKPSDNVVIHRYPHNISPQNLTNFIVEEINDEYEYYIISDPDIQPHPNTPYNFIDIWVEYIKSGFHRVGFNLITNDLPLWLNEREMIIGNEAELLRNPIVTYGGFIGYKAPIDTTFALYTTKNSGWKSPMNGEDWGNSLRLFNAFHFGWYIDGGMLNEEMHNYFTTAKYRIPGQPSAGSNNNRPKEFINE